jgi:hypothetical protein
MTRRRAFQRDAVFLCFGLVVPCALGGDVTDKGTATLTLTVPYHTILRDEVVRFTVRLRNDSKENLRCIPDPYEAPGKQVFINVERGDPNFPETMITDARPEFTGGRVLRIERDGNWQVVAKEATGVLRPGEAVEWDGSRFDPRLFWIKLGKPKTVQAQVLIGPGQWVNSKPVPIKVIDRDLSSSPVVFAGSYLWSPQKVKCLTQVHRVSIEGKEYLFGGECARICEIPKGATPEFGWDPETALLTVRFPGLNVPPIRYNYPQMQVLRPQPEGASKTP